MIKFRYCFLCPIVVLIPILLFTFCGEKSKERKITQETKEVKPGEFPETGPVSVRKYDVPPGADPSVPPEQGGKGFTGEGWETSTTFKSYADPNAKKGGVLTLAMGEFPNTFRAIGKESNTTDISLINNLVYESMLGFEAESMEYKPSLATHWKISDDRKTFWFRIDPNARWSNGNPVTAYDVVASWKIRIDEGIESPSTKMTYEKYEFTSESKYIVKVTVKANDWKLFLYSSGMSVFPASHLDKIDGKGYLEKYQFNMLPGTGPYILDGTKTQKGVQVVMRRRSDYWAAHKPENKGYYNFDELKWIIIRDENLRKEKFKKGEYDLYSINRAQWWVQEFDLKDESFDALHRGLIQKRKCFNYEPKGLSGIAFNMRKPPFDDIRVRKAFSHLFNVEQ
ncbi:MAG: ABC transporter substrate-binding protein, partial [Chitinispirillia bacterium]